MLGHVDHTEYLFTPKRGFSSLKRKNIRLLEHPVSIQSAQRGAYRHAEIREGEKKMQTVFFKMPPLPRCLTPIASVASRTVLEKATPRRPFEVNTLFLLLTRLAAELRRLAWHISHSCCHLNIEEPRANIPSFYAAQTSSMKIFSMKRSVIQVRGPEQPKDTPT